MDVVIRMFNLIDCNDNYAKISENLWQYRKDDPNDNIANSESFEFKSRITRRTPAAGNTKDVGVAF